jgi:hypothetical protein
LIIDRDNSEKRGTGQTCNLLSFDLDTSECELVLNVKKKSIWLLEHAPSKTLSVSKINNAKAIYKSKYPNDYPRANPKTVVNPVNIPKQMPKHKITKTWEEKQIEVEDSTNQQEQEIVSNNEDIVELPKKPNSPIYDGIVDLVSRAASAITSSARTIQESIGTNPLPKQGPKLKTRKADVAILPQEQTKGNVDQVRNTEQMKTQRAIQEHTKELNNRPYSSSGPVNAFDKTIPRHLVETSNSSHLNTVDVQDPRITTANSNTAVSYGSSLSSYSSCYTSSSIPKVVQPLSTNSSNTTSQTSCISSSVPSTTISKTQYLASTVPNTCSSKNSLVSSVSSKESEFLMKSKLSELSENVVKISTCVDDGKELVLNPEGEGNIAHCLMMTDLIVDLDLYTQLKDKTPRMKGHKGKKAFKNTIAVYVISSDGITSELRSIDGIIDIISMLVFAEGSERGMIGISIEGTHYNSIKNKLLGLEPDWKFKGILSVQLSQLIFTSGRLNKWHNKWNGMVSTQVEQLKTRVTCYNEM